MNIVITVFIDCGDPSPANGQTAIPGGTTYSQNATVACDPGYTLTGDTQITCQDTGAWSGVPVCSIQGTIFF